LVEKLDALKDNEKEKRNKILKEIALLDHRVTALKTLANARLKGIDGKNADGGDFLAYVPEQLPTDVRRSLLFGSGSYTDFGRVKRDVFNAWRTGKAKAGTKEHRDLSDKFERGELDADLFAWWNKATPATLRDKGIPSSEDYLDEQGMLRPGIVQSVTAPGDVDLDAPHSAKQLGFDVPGIAPNRYESNRTGGFWSTRLFKLFRPNNEEWLQKQREIDQKRLKNLKKGSAGFGGEREEIERSKKELRILRKRKAERLKFMRDAEGKPRSSDEIKSIHDDKRATFTELVTVQDDGSVEISDDGVKALAEAQILKPGRTQVADSKDKESRDERKEREKVEKAIKSRNKKEDVALAHFWEKARFNEKPTVVSEEEFIEQAKQPGAIVIRRGVGGRTFANDYLDDDNRYTTRRGGVMQGPGEYWAVRVDDGKDVRGTSEGWNAYVSADNQGGKPGTEPGPGGIMAVLPADAKIITKAELQQIRTDLGKVAGPLKVAFDSPLLPKDLRNKIAGKNAEQLLELIDSEVLGKIPLDDPRWKTAAGQMILQLINKAKSGNEATRKDALSALAFLIGGLDGHLQNMLAPIFGYDAIRADSGVMLVMNRGALIAYGGVGGLSLTNAVERAVLEGSRVPTDIAKKANNGERVD
jgi:hypothetical protein